MNHDLIVTEPQGLSRFFSLGYLSSGEHGVHWSCGRCGQDTAIGQETVVYRMSMTNWVLFSIHLPCPPQECELLLSPSLSYQ